MAILNTLLEITIYSGVIVIITMLLKTVFKRRMSPWLHYAVWLVLIARLMLPVTVESGFHVFTAPAQVQSETTAIPQAQTDITSAEPANKVNYGYQPQPVKKLDSDTSASSPVSSAAPVTNKPLSTEDVLLIAWSSGAGISILYIILLYGTLRHRVRKNAAEPSAHLLALFDDVKTDMNIRARLKLVCQYDYGTPALLLPRTVLMPVDTLVTMDDEQVRFALRHELTHYRHRDHLTCLLLCVLNAVYWFNPFVWLAFRQMRTDMEVACDGAVVKMLDVPQKSRYASLIVKLFAQPPQRQLVLGMAQGDAKKIAEQRVRGIFKEAKSHKSVKFISALVAVLLLLTCFTTACQPTPETPPVVKKGNLDSVISKNPTPETPSAIPEPSAKDPINWRDQYVDDKGIFHVNIKAIVETPDVTAYPIIEMKRVSFTDEQLQKVVSTFFGNEPIYNGNVPRTKEQIADDIIQLEGRHDEMIDSGNADFYEQNLNLLNEAYNRAPETVALEPAKAVWSDEDPSFVNIMASNNNKLAYIQGAASVSKDRYSCLEYNIKGSYYHEISELSEQPSGVKMSEQDALSLAGQALESIGLENMMLEAKLVGSRIDNPLNTTDQCYIFYYTRTTDNIPFTYVNNYNSDNVGDTVDAYAPHLYKEYISISINDDGIVNFRWENPYEEVTRISDNANLLDFEQIKQIFMKQMQREAAGRNEYYDKTEIVSDEVNVYKVSLGYMPTVEKNNYDTYICVPVWNFFATSSINYEDGTVNDEINSYFSYSIVTINALDGSLINGYLGY